MSLKLQNANKKTRFQVYIFGMLIDSDLLRPLPNCMPVRSPPILLLSGSVVSPTPQQNAVQLWRHRHR